MFQQYATTRALFIVSLLVTNVGNCFTVPVSSRLIFNEAKMSGNGEVNLVDGYRYPKLIVFDLDMCLWSPETYLLHRIPSASDAVKGKLGKSEQNGVIAVNCGNDRLQLFPGALLALQSYVQGELGEDTKIAVASSADTPQAVQIAKAALSLLEVLPGVTVRDALQRGWEQGFEGNILIGRERPLSSSKAHSHFPLLQANTNIPFEGMLYFDDCNWDDHCRHVTMKCKGVVAHRTPEGLTEDDWFAGLKKYHESHQS